MKKKMGLITLTALCFLAGCSRAVPEINQHAGVKTFVLMVEERDGLGVVAVTAYLDGRAVHTFVMNVEGYVMYFQGK